MFRVRANGVRGGLEGSRALEKGGRVLGGRGRERKTCREGKGNQRGRTKQPGKYLYKVRDQFPEI